MSATLYELTAHAAQMCLPVPTPDAAPAGWVDRFDHWQTLLGNIVGGTIGIAGALIVAAQMRRHERRIAAGTVLPDLRRLATTDAEVGRYFPVQRPATAPAPEGLQGDPAWQAASLGVVVSFLAKSRPPLLALHGLVLGQLTGIDARLSSHLFQCEMAHRLFEDGVGVYQAPHERLKASLRGTAADAPSASADRIYADWQRAVEHATLAAYFLDRFVFSRWPRWVQRTRMKLWPNHLDQRSAHLIRTGELLPPPSGEPGAAAPA